MSPSAEIYDYFEEFATTRWDVASADVESFAGVLETAVYERDIQAYLQTRPQLLCAYMRSGHGEWVIPQMRLGAEYVPDFVIGHGNSGGVLWDFIELESPLASFTIQNGQPAKELRTAIYQIDCWRAWLESNLDYARRPPSAHGLGLEEVSPRSRAKIVIGRRKNITPEFNQLRKKLRETDNVEVITYDRLLDDFRWINNIIRGCRGEPTI